MPGAHAWARRLMPVALWFCASPLAHAHTATKGVGDVTNGLLHPLQMPSHLLILLALGLYGAQRSSRGTRQPILVFTVAAIAGLALTIPNWFKEVPSWALSVVALGIAILVALRAALPVAASSSIYALGAMVVTLDSGIDQAPLIVALKTLFGTFCAILAIVTSTTFYVRQIPRKNWIKIAIRVLASWIAAIALLMIAFAFRKTVKPPAAAPAQTTSHRAP